MVRNIFCRWLCKAKTTNNGSDFSEFARAMPLTRKQQLINDCEKHGVPIYIDDSAERSLIFRHLASDAEIYRRLNSRIAVCYSKRANIISISSLAITLADLCIPLL